MKKTIAVLSIFAFIVIASPAMAGGVKVPKILCLGWDLGEFYHQLVLKKMGSIPTPDGKVDSYTITGHTYADARYPVSGSAYVVPGTTTLHATFNGQNALTFRWLGSFELIFDLGANTGTLQYRLDSPDGTTVLQNGVAVHGMDCNDPTLTITQ